MQQYVTIWKPKRKIRGCASETDNFQLDSIQWIVLAITNIM